MSPACRPSIRYFFASKEGSLTVAALMFRAQEDSNERKAGEESDDHDEGEWYVQELGLIVLW